MKFTELADDPEDSQHSPAERAAAASRSTWVSVGVNLCLSFTQITIGVLAKNYEEAGLMNRREYTGNLLREAFQALDTGRSSGTNRTSVGAYRT